jgi:hypothetical protein
MYCLSLSVYIQQVRVENVKNPEDYVAPMLERVRPEYIRRTYDVRSWDNHEDFLSKVAKKTGKLLKVSLLALYCDSMYNANH